MAKEKIKQPCVTHIMADQRRLSDLKGYGASFDRLPEAAQRLLVRLALGPVCWAPLEKDEGAQAR